MATSLSATATSNVNNNRNANLAQMDNLTQQINNISLEEQYWNKKLEYSETIIGHLDEVINMEGFHPIQKTKARIAKAKEKPVALKCKGMIVGLQTKRIRLEMELARKKAKDMQTARDNENTGFMQRKMVAGKPVQIKDGKIDLSKREFQDIYNNLYDKNTGEPTANFETLKQILVDYPMSITTLPDNVVKQLDRGKVNVRIVQAQGVVNGQPIQLVYDKQMSSFDYLKGMAAAGMQIAENQGRDLQANPENKVEFANWLQEKEAMLQAAKASANQNQNNNTYQATF